MKFIKYARLILTVFFISIIASCSLSTEDLSKEVQKSISEKMKDQNITVKSFILTKKGGNEYSGILETKEENGEFSYTVEVIYDGENMKWEIKE